MPSQDSPGIYGSFREQRWIMNLRKKGLSPTLEILETVEASNDAATIVRDREHYWIREMARLGHPLLNVYGVQHTYWNPSVRESSKLKNASSTRDTSNSPVEVEKTLRADQATRTFYAKEQIVSDKHNVMGTRDHLTITDVARDLGVNEKTVRRWIKSGELRATKDILGRYRIAKADLDNFVR